MSDLYTPAVLFTAAQLDAADRMAPVKWELVPIDGPLSPPRAREVREAMTREVTPAEILSTVE